MTDEKLDQILKQALTPTIDDSEIQIRRKVRDNRMSRKKFIAGGLAACAVLAFIVVGRFPDIGSKAGEEAVSLAETEPHVASTNLFAITAYAAELPEGIMSGDVIALRRVEIDHASLSYLDGRFTIDGQNIAKVKVTTDKCNLYTAVPIYRGDPEYEKAENSIPNDHESFDPIYKSDPKDEEGRHIEYYDHSQIVGPSYEGAYNAQMSFGMSIPEELWNTSEDPKKDFWAAIDQVDGAKLTIEVTFIDGNTETHHYRLMTGKIFVPVDNDGILQWDNLTRFLTDEEEKDINTPFAYGYLIKKLD